MRIPKPKLSEEAKETVVDKAQKLQNYPKLKQFIESSEEDSLFSMYYKGARKFSAESLDSAVYTCIMAAYIEKLIQNGYCLTKSIETPLPLFDSSVNKRLELRNTTNLISHEIKYIKNEENCFEFLKKFKEDMKNFIKALIELHAKEGKTPTGDTIPDLLKAAADALGIHIVFYNNKKREKIKCCKPKLYTSVKVDLFVDMEASSCYELYRSDINPFSQSQQFLEEYQKLSKEVIYREPQTEELNNITSKLKEELEKIKETPKVDNEAEKLAEEVEANNKIIKEFEKLVESNPVLMYILRSKTNRSIIGLKKEEPGVKKYLKTIESLLKVEEVKKVEAAGFNWAEGKCKGCSKKTKIFIRFASCKADCNIKLCPKCLVERMKGTGELKTACFGCYEDLDPKDYDKLLEEANQIINEQR